MKLAPCKNGNGRNYPWWLTMMDHDYCCSILETPLVLQVPGLNKKSLIFNSFSRSNWTTHVLVMIDNIWHEFLVKNPWFQLVSTGFNWSNWSDPKATRSSVPWTLRATATWPSWAAGSGSGSPAATRPGDRPWDAPRTSPRRRWRKWGDTTNRNMRNSGLFLGGEE